MNKREDTRRWVWWSDERSVREGTVSVLAIAETIAATGLGIWLWFHIGLYPLLLTSAVMAFLTMLRSDASIALGVKWFTAYEKQFDSDSKPSTRKVLLIALLPLLVSGLATYWLALHWLPDHTGWSLFWRAAVLGIAAMNIAFAGAAAAAGASAAAIAMAVAAMAAGAVAGAAMAAVAGAAMAVVAGAAMAAVAGVGVGVVAGVLLIIPGVVLGVFCRALATRAFATLRHFSEGLSRLPVNWASLITTLDLRAPPDLVPGMPEGSGFQISGYITRVRSGADLVDKAIGFFAILILFGPTYLFRLTLKSTFLLYWPLLFIASAPSAYRTTDGSLVWDDARGRRLLDWISAAIAVLALISIGWSVYDHGVYARLIEWADARELPAHAMMRLIAFDVWRLGPWEWSALVTSAITVILFVWTNAINVRYRAQDRRPGWATLKVIYALGRLQTLLVAATILTILFTLTWFVHDTCTLPDMITGWLTHVFGSPQACINVPGPFAPEQPIEIRALLDAPTPAG